MQLNLLISFIYRWISFIYQSSRPSNVRFLYPQNFRSKSVKTSVYKHDWNSFITIFISHADWSCLLCSQVGFNNVHLFASQVDQSMFTFVNFPRHGIKLFLAHVFILGLNIQQNKFRLLCLRKVRKCSNSAAQIQ